MSGGIYPDSIAYDADNRVDFIWGVIDVRAGWRVDTRRLLESIETYGKGQKASVYRFTYEQHPYNGRSWLVNFRQYTADDSSFLPAHSFSWNNGGSGGYALSDTIGIYGGVPSSNIVNQKPRVHVNGTGLSMAFKTWGTKCT